MFSNFTFNLPLIKVLIAAQRMIVTMVTALQPTDVSVAAVLELFHCLCPCEHFYSNFKNCIKYKVIFQMNPNKMCSSVLGFLGLRGWVYFAHTHYMGIKN